jgi:glycosyltransferase involved in cell wall biosynthesis
MNKDNPNILYLGYSGFPYGQAEFQKILLISKTLIDTGASVTIVGRRGLYTSEFHPDIKRVGHLQRIKYLYTPVSPFRISSFLKRNIKKPFEGIVELIVLKKLNKKRKIDVAIISTMNFRHLLFYKVLSSLLRFKIILNFVEYNSSMSSRKGLSNKINDYFFDRFAVELSDGILVISEFLISIIKEISPGKPYLKIPMMVDIDRYNGIEKFVSTKYFLFCGAAGYKEIILFNINSFELISEDNIFLYLVVNGNPDQLNEIKNYIAKSSKRKMIRLINNLSDRELSEMYKNAIGLLIPLRPTIQDKARFPHKFGEYLATGNPVVTTNYGEVKYYFKDAVNALVADLYDEKAFAEKMSYIITNPAEVKIIGENGKKVALEYADYKKYGRRIINFIHENKLWRKDFNNY